MIYISAGFISIVIGLCYIIGSEKDGLLGQILTILAAAMTSFFVIKGLHYMCGDTLKAKSYEVTIEKEDVTEAYQVTSYSIDGDTVKLVLEGGNVEYYVLKKGESVKCQQ